MNKVNVIKDERIGAHDNQLSLEEKMLQRFALERKRKHEKVSLFKLVPVVFDCQVFIDYLYMYI